MTRIGRPPAGDTIRGALLHKAPGAANRKILNGLAGLLRRRYAGLKKMPDNAKVDGTFCGLP